MGTGLSAGLHYLHNPAQVDVPHFTLVFITPKQKLPQE